MDEAENNQAFFQVTIARLAAQTILVKLYNKQNICYKH